MPRKRPRVAAPRYPLPEPLWQYLSDRFDMFGGPGHRAVMIGGRGVEYTDESLQAMWQEHREALMAEAERKYGTRINPWPARDYDGAPYL